MKFSGAAGNRAWLAILFALILPQPLLPQAQNMQFEHLTIEDGLSQNTVRCILQDRLGFMWFGTDDDLNKFDGYRFTHYKNRHGDATTLSNNTINVIYEDKSGTLWIGTNGGLNRFDRRSETFRHFRHDPNNPNSLHDNIVSAIYEDAAGTLWIGTQKGLNKMDRSTPGQETFTRYQHRFGEYDDPIIQWVQGIGEYVGEYDSLLFVGSWGAGLLRFDRKTERYSQCPLPYVSSEFELRRWISGIHVDRAGDIWVANDDIHKYDPQMGTFRTVFKAGFTDNSAHALRVHKSALGELIIGTSAKGLVLLDGELKISTRLRHNPNDPNSLSDDRITAIYEDNTGTIWIGTKKGGINKYDPRGKRFTGYRFNASNSKGLNDDNIIASLSTRSGLFLVTFKNYGVYVLDHQRKTMTPYRNFFRNASDQNRFSIKMIYQDSAGRIWFGDWGFGLYQYSSDEPDAKLLHHFRVDHDDSTTLIDNFVGAICESREGELWIGTSLGISVIRLENLAKGEFKNYRHNPGDSTSLGDLRADVILQDHIGQIWIGANGGGLSLFNRQTDSFVRFKHNPYDANTLSSDVVLSIFQDSQDRLWIGTRAGLNRFDYETGTFIHYTESDGLPNAVINGIVEDAYTNLWLSTNNGLSKFDPDRETFKNYDANDGLPSQEFHANAIYKNGVTGEIIVRGPRGLTVFHPDSIRDNDFIPPVVITSFKRYNIERGQATAIEEKGITTRDHLELSYKDNILTFELAALSYRNTAKNQYAYKMQGFNDNWIQLGTKREITFTNLDPGEYTLHVKGSNNDGVWNEKATLLEITIAPPWWQTWWAYTLYGVLILGFLYGIRRYEMNRQRYKHGLELERVESEKLKELDSLKSRFFANISHEFRTPLTLILGPVHNMLQRLSDKASQKDLKMMQRNANRLLRLINQLLDLSKLDAGKLILQASPGDFIPFLKGLVFSFESLAASRNIDLHFDAHGCEIMLYFDRDKMEKIISNLLSNAFKFTEDGGSVEVLVNSGQYSVFSIQFSVNSNKAETADLPLNTENRLLITVKNTGTGIPADRLPHIFERFYQAGDSHAKDVQAPLDKINASDEAARPEYYPTGQGSGIGLALTKELVELHHGKISVTSEIGKGTEFIISLPLGMEHLEASEILDIPLNPPSKGDFSQPSTRFPAPSSQQPAASNQQPATSNQHQATTDNKQPLILIVEDNPDMRTFIGAQLLNSFQIIEAEDGDTGYQKAGEAIPDLIISDVMMPKMDGYQLCEKLKTDERTSHIPVILLTAKSSGESKVEGLELGADDYLIKPFDSRELLVRVKNLIAQRQKLRQRFGREIKLQPKDIAITSADARFLQRVVEIINAHLSDEEFSVEQFGREVGLSRGQLHRKLKGLTDQAPVEFIRTIRLKRAAQLLEQQYGTVAEIAYEVGFGDPSYFTRCFRQQFGIAPSDYAGKARTLI